MGVLYDFKEERFCQLVTQGLEPKDARRQAGYPKSPGKWSVRKLLVEPRIRDRIDSLREGAANRAVLSRMDILDGIREEWRLARAVAQHGAALKAAEMLGSELHSMFTKKVELGKVGDFENQTEEQLRVYIENQMKELGMSAPKLIEVQANPDSPSAEPISDANSVTAER